MEHTLEVQDASLSQISKDKSKRGEMTLKELLKKVHESKDNKELKDAGLFCEQRSI